MSNADVWDYRSQHVQNRRTASCVAQNSVTLHGLTIVTSLVDSEVGYALDAILVSGCSGTPSRVSL